MITHVVAIPEAHVGCTLDTLQYPELSWCKTPYTTICRDSDTDSTENTARDAQLLFER